MHEQDDKNMTRDDLKLGVYVRSTHKTPQWFGKITDVDPAEDRVTIKWLDNNVDPDGSMLATHSERSITDFEDLDYYLVVPEEEAAMFCIANM